MKTILTVVLTLAAANIGYGQPLSTEMQIVFRNVSVVSPDDERVIERQTVVIDDGRIITEEVPVASRESGMDSGRRM